MQGGGEDEEEGGKMKRRPHSIRNSIGNSEGEVACRVRNAGCVFACTSFVYSVVGKMAAGCAVLFFTRSLCAIDFASAWCLSYLNLKMSVLVITSSIKRQAAWPQPGSLGRRMNY